MISKSIIKLIDETIIPGVALIAAKMLGLFLVSYFLGLSFTVENGKLFYVLPKVSFANFDEYTRAENFSNLVMFSVAALGTFFVVIRAHFFHESHIKPNVQAKLFSLNLENLIAPSYHLYHQAAIWLIFLWLTTGFLLISTLILHVTYPIITAIAFIIAANFTWILVMDIEKEVELSKN